MGDVANARARNDVIAAPYLLIELALKAVDTSEGGTVIVGGVDSYPICIDSKDPEVLIRTIAAIAPVRSLLVAVGSLAWKATGEHPALQALDTLRALYAAGDKTLPVDVTAARLGAAWRQDIADTDRDGRSDGLENPDKDALTNRYEYLSGTNPRKSRATFSADIDASGTGSPNGV